MPRQVTSKGLKAIIRHNVLKELKKMNLTGSEYENILKVAEDFVANA